MAYESNKAKIATHPGKHGEHPVGGAVGAAVGAAMAAAGVGAAQGATAGAVAGMPGMVAGAAIGGVVGALAGKGLAQEINPTTEGVYWREHYHTRQYIDKDENYDTYRPAYRHGVEAFTKYPNQDFDKIEPQLEKEWETWQSQLAVWQEAFWSPCFSLSMKS